jgi:hypothetical protein
MRFSRHSPPIPVWPDKEPQDDESHAHFPLSLPECLGRVSFVGSFVFRPFDPRSVHQPTTTESVGDIGLDRKVYPYLSNP